MAIILFSLLGFLIGSIPFAVLIGKGVLKTDIRTVGDGNPGGSNVWKAGGWKVGLLATVLEIGKGFLPVYLAQRYGLRNWNLVPVALSPVFGHVLQPFLKFRGGKALGATGGAWVALIGLWAFPVYAAYTLPVLAIQSEHAWAALAGMFSLMTYAGVIAHSPSLTFLAGMNVLITIYTHRAALREPVRLRPWLTRFYTRE